MNAEDTRAYMQILVTVVGLVAGLVFLGTGVGDDSLDKVAAGWVGAIIGYWLS